MYRSKPSKAICACVYVRARGHMCVCVCVCARAYALPVDECWHAVGCKGWLLQLLSMGAILPGCRQYQRAME